MFKNSYQNGLLSIFYSCGSNPLAIWDMEVKNGHIKRLTDNEVNSIVLEIVSTNVATTYIACPKNNQVLGIKLPFLVMIVKNMKRYFSFEITVLDDKNMRRRFRISNFQSTTKIKPFCTSMPIGLAHGWNQIQFNLADFTKRAYGTHFIETLRVQVHANARVRRIYFSERLYTEEELPQDYKLYLPLERKHKGKVDKKSDSAPAAAAATAPPVTEAAAPPPEAGAPPSESVLRPSLAAKASRKTVSTVSEGESEKTEGEKAPGATVSEAGTEEAPSVTPGEGEATPVAEGEVPTDATDVAPEEALAQNIEEPGNEDEAIEEGPAEVPVEAPADEPAEAPAEEAAADSAPE